jgi:diguanylate cyclase (GGDEF)-like protein
MKNDGEPKNSEIFNGAVQQVTAEAVLKTVRMLRGLGNEIHNDKALETALLHSPLVELVETLDWKGLLDREEAYTDSLTRVRNRRYLDEELPRMLSRAGRTGGRVAFILLDADHFKAINDNFGHQTGDEVLRDIAQRLKTAVRTNDIVARYGGEEFAVVMELQNGEDWDAALKRLESAMCNKENCLFKFENKTHAVTCSVGAAFGDERTPPKDLISRADIRAYQAKQSGRAKMIVEVPRSRALVVTPSMPEQ